MNKIFSIILLIFSATFSFTHETIKITIGEWPPFISEESENYGFLSLLVSETFELVDVKVEYGFYPWKRSYEMAKSGEWDASIGWSKTKEREVDFYFSSAIGKQSKVIMFLKSKPVNYKTAMDLKGISLGKTRGYTYGPIFDKAAKDGVFKSSDTNSDSQSIKMLLNGRFDAIAAELEVANYILEKEFGNSKDKVSFGPVMDEIPLNVAFTKSPRGEALHAKFEEGLLKLKVSGRYDAILNTYKY